MFTLLSRLFVRNYDQPNRPEVRRAYGTLCTSMAIGLNIVLVIIKILAAKYSGSFSIFADAINNLSDVGSSVLLLLAFSLAGMTPCPDHPFGHGRIEYVAGFVVSALIIVCGVEIGRDAIKHIIHPSEITFAWSAVWIMLISIAVKLYLSFCFRRTAKKINSEALHATSVDSLSDTISTFATLAGFLIFHFTPNNLNLDGWLGLFVALLILKAGIDSAKGTLLQLLGTKPSPELVNKIKKICLDSDKVIGLHDVVVHDYGPGRLHVSVHCEVPGNRNIYELHDEMDCLMNKLDSEIGCTSIIHMDPVCTDDVRIKEMHDKVLSLITAKFGPNVMIHDFRLVEGPTHTNILFDCVVPYDLEKDDKKAHQIVCKIVSEQWNNTFPIVKIDRPYV